MAVTQEEVMLYAKIFDSILYGQLADDYQTRHIFMDLVLLADWEGNVPMGVNAIMRNVNWEGSKEQYQEHLDLLMRPDCSSKLDAEEGRRIVPIEGAGSNSGFKVVNLLHYREKQSPERKREQDRQRAAKHRANGSNAASRYKDKDKEVDQEQLEHSPLKHTPPFLQADWDQLKENYPRRSGGQKWPLAKERAKRLINCSRVTISELILRVKAYNDHVTATNKIGTVYTMQAATFFSQGWDDEYDNGREVVKPRKLTAGQRVRQAYSDETMTMIPVDENGHKVLDS